MHHPGGSDRIAFVLATVLGTACLPRPAAAQEAPLPAQPPPPSAGMFAFHPLPEHMEWGMAEEKDDLDPLFFEPDLGRASIAAIIRTSPGRPGLAVPFGVIRDGFASNSAANVAWDRPERAVGMRFGADIFSISTKLTTPAGGATGRDAAIDWRLGKPVGNAGPGFIWSISTGGRGGVATNPEQDAQMLLGYRYRLFDHLTLTSQVEMSGNYVFVPGSGWDSRVTPELKISADLAAIVKLPLAASLDLSVARQVPLVSNDFETRGTAMLRFRYTLD